ncbi:6-carboxytetrahydropterin synthase QueD [Staphylococcus pasteuri]|uniref:6-carboxytetrahydropterin synthase QueD n=1 Tax=Staphylococcus pasteuri TaxID=45972 RepID=UPI001E44BCD2|nr:6-carboxytetrahydropterin synthase QueD [Staphylococcus pasteuri]MCD9066093.1 6-carboxytetrahydropterin synthase QueD [Staphylococcus pasteuri]WAE41396.1 6-carboxytetrahydropterin synthase QueD [Staphylococcus pasteuri]
MLQQIYPSVSHPYQFELNKDFNFSAAHYIPSEDAGKCMRTHGHTYFVNITIVGDELDHNGFLVNFSDLKQLIHGQFDHYLLNDLVEFKDKSPSTEIVAQTIYQMVQSYLNEQDNNPKCVQVYLRETPTSYVVFRPKDEQ